MSLSQYTQTYVFILFITRIGLLVESQSCNIAYECVGTEWTLSDSISGAGYKSLFGSNTSIIGTYTWGNIQCSGAYSCTEISFILSQYTVMCYGSHSCSNIAGPSYIDTSDDVYCYGSNSCTNSNIRANNVYCSGDQSCNYANISALRVTADAAYSLYGATIDSKNITGELFVYLWGYQSGFGANIICRSGDVCNIFCYYNGCQMLYLLCEDDTNCNLIMSSNDPTITSTPIQKLADFDANFYDMKYMNHDSNALCNNSSEIVAYDNYQQQQVAYDTYNGGVCCRGSQSCQLAYTIQVTAYVQSPDIIVCSGYWSCATTIITTTGPTFCEGHKSCYSATINGSDNVYCLGAMPVIKV